MRDGSGEGGGRGGMKGGTVDWTDRGMAKKCFQERKTAKSNKKEDFINMAGRGAEKEKNIF